MKCKLCKNAGGKEYRRGQSSISLCPSCLLDALEKRIVIFDTKMIKLICEIRNESFPIDQWRLFWQKGYNHALCKAGDGSFIRMPDLENFKPKSTSPVDRYIASRRIEAFYQGAMSGMTVRCCNGEREIFYSAEYVGGDARFEEVDLSRFEEKEIRIVSFWRSFGACGQYVAYCVDGVAYAYYFQPGDGEEGWQIDHEEISSSGTTWRQGEVFKKKEKKNE
jgi:hypothetical protein